MKTVMYTIYICTLLIFGIVLVGIAYAEEVDPPMHGPVSCRYCHRVNESGSHFTHIYAERGPYMICTNCHSTDEPNTFKDGNSFSDTIICNTCHSPGGTFDGISDSVIGAKPNWQNRIYNGSDLKAGKEKWCVGCHDDDPAIVKGEIAFNKSGDNNIYGYYITGHGRISPYDRMSWQSFQDTGNPGANKTCDACHNITSRHIIIGTGGNGNDRLKPGYANNQNNDNCNNCHNGTGSGPQFYTDSVDFEASSHGGKNCTDCHDVHGLNGKGMTKGVDEELCNKCHNSHAGHALDVQFGKGGKNYSLECTSCHNIHVISGGK